MFLLVPSLFYLKRCILFISLLCLPLGYSQVVYSQGNEEKGKIIIVLDDVGYNLNEVEALKLPTEVAFAILPKTPHSRLFAELAHEQGRDVMLHLPMSATNNNKLGPSALTVGMFSEDLEKVLDEALNSVPYAIGVNNHMGSYLTTQQEAMNKLMVALKRQSLFFLDSRTTPHSIAYETAKRVGIPTDQRHIFLDHQQTEAFYQQQFLRLIRIAKKHGRAIGIAHPYPSSLTFLQSALVNIEQYGVELYSVSDYFTASKPNLRSSATAQQKPSTETQHQSFVGVQAN